MMIASASTAYSTAYRLASWVAAQPGDWDPNSGRDPEWGKAAPAGLLIWLFLGVMLFLLIKSMNRHMRRVPKSFADGAEGDGSVGDESTADGAGSPADAARDGAASAAPQEPAPEEAVPEEAVPDGGRSGADGVIGAAPAAGPTALPDAPGR